MSDCIEWTHSIGSHGYGQMWCKGTVVLAHRVTWENNKGPIPENMFVLHRCDNKKCVNIEHLFLGTHTDNMQDSLKKGRHWGSSDKGRAHISKVGKKQVENGFGGWVGSEAQKEHLKKLNGGRS